MGELNDPELEAMAEISKAISKIEDEQGRIRVLRWVAEKFTPSAITSAINDNTKSLPGPSPDEDVSEEPEFNLFADLYDAVDPQKDADRLITAAYWLQVIEGNDSWNAYSVNKLLKDTGYGVSDISHRFSNIQNGKPALIRQVAKSGRSRQAKKTYKLTVAGINSIKTRLKAPTNSQESE